MDYREKYKKYKTKYVQLKGGKLTFINELMKTSIISGIPQYETFQMESARFTDEQRAAVDNLCTKVLPTMTLNGTLIDKKHIDNISAVGAGSFGISVCVGDLLIKIIPFKETTTIGSLAREILTLNDIFITPKLGNPSKEFLSEYYGYMTTNDILGTHLDATDNHLSYNKDLFDKTKIHSNLSQTDRALRINIDALDNADIIGSNQLLFIFSSKSKKDLDSFCSSIMSLRNFKRGPYITACLKQVSDGLHYLHELRYIHNDIKPTNIVMDYIKTTQPNQVKFKIIDFGLCNKLPPTLLIIPYPNYGTHEYTVNTPFMSTRSFLFDWHCLYITMMHLLNVTDVRFADKDGHKFFGTQLPLNDSPLGSHFPGHDDVFFNQLQVIMNNAIKMHSKTFGQRLIILNALLCLACAQYVQFHLINGYPYNVRGVEHDKVKISIVTKTPIKTVEEYEIELLRRVSLIDLIEFDP